MKRPYNLFILNQCPDYQISTSSVCISISEIGVGVNRYFTAVRVGIRRKDTYECKKNLITLVTDLMYMPGLITLSIL